MNKVCEVGHKPMMWSKCSSANKFLLKLSNITSKCDLTISTCSSTSTSASSVKKVVNGTRSDRIKNARSRAEECNAVQQERVQHHAVRRIQRRCRRDSRLELEIEHQLQRAAHVFRQLVQAHQRPRVEKPRELSGKSTRPQSILAAKH